MNLNHARLPIPPFPQGVGPKGWSWRWDSNPQPADYKSAALPIELRQHEARSVCGSCHESGDPEGARTLDLQRDRLAL